MKTIRFAALTLLAGGLAAAQTADPLAPPDCPPDPAAVPAPEPTLPLPVDPASAGQTRGPRHVFSRIGLGALIGGGVTQYFDDAVDDRLQAGGSWSARLELGTRSYLGGEVGYVGSAQQLEGFSGTDALLVSNGVEGLLRWNILTGAIQPYLGAGLGWKDYRLRNTSVTFADITPQANFAHVPTAAGIAFRGGGLIIDTRFSVGVPISPDLIGNSRLISWDATGRVGFEF